MRLFPVAPFVIVLAAAGCGDPASPAGPTSVRLSSASDGAAVAGGSPSSSQTVPFKGSLRGEADPPVFEPPPSPYFTAHLQAEGQATHLGRFSMDYSHRVNLATLVAIGHAVFTAANGDTLMTDVQGEATPAGTPTAFTVVERHTITGGTGRFAGATGEFTVTSAVDFSDPFTSGEIDGWISAPGGKF
jgi:hypothetical protein